MKATYEIARDRIRYIQIRLTVVDGIDHGAELLSAGAEVTVGSDSGNDLVLTDSAVSRYHLGITVTGEGMRLRDLESTNGTFVGGARVNDALLWQRTTIEIGRSKLLFETDAMSVTEPLSTRGNFGPVTGESPAMRRVFAVLEKVSDSNASILIEGETGTGKSLIAEAIHSASSRRDAPFITVDCGALSEGVLDSELFGHERGAFTGAETERRGLFEQAHGGTVLLDEIGELPLVSQPKLLRLLENHRVRPVGSTREKSIDVRVIAATNRDLRREVNRGAMRADLFYRLAGVRLVIPPLRERREDIRALVEDISLRLVGDPEALPEEQIEAMAERTWSGNVRELHNAVERALLFRDRSEVLKYLADTAEPLPGQSYRDLKANVIETWERDYVAGLVRKLGGNVSAAARAAQTSRNHFSALVEKYGITGVGRKKKND